MFFFRLLCYLKLIRKPNKNLKNVYSQRSLLFNLSAQQCGFVGTVLVLLSLSSSFLLQTDQMFTALQGNEQILKTGL